MQLNMGAFGAGSASASGLPGAQTPAAAGASPQGPTTIGQKAFGIVTGSEGGPATAGIGLLAAGALSLAGLFWIWYSLPR
jgi:hypothetical protein